MTSPARFADSYYFIALLNPNDQHHEAARLATQNASGPLVTTSLVLVEVAGALSSPLMRGLVHEFLEGIRQDPTTEVVLVDDGLLDRGVALYGARADKSWSLTDCISFVVMNERGITEALTGDHHFEQAGFRAVLKMQ